MPAPNVITGTLLEGQCLTLEQLCGACAVTAEWVSIHVREGRLQPPGEGPAQWRFSSRDLWRVRRIRQLEVAFDAEPELAALFADLLEEVDRLRARLGASGL
jgi:chaperone modulatory protein CbpM